jgi:hypothetical protein
VQFVIAAGVVIAAVTVASVLRRRRQTEPPTQPNYEVPRQLDRDDFAEPEREWLLAVFTSTTCESCAAVATKAQVLASPSLVVQIVSYQDQRELHRRYSIDAVPAVVLADREGVVRFGALGPMGASGLWANVAEARDRHTEPGA